MRRARSTVTALLLLVTIVGTTTAQAPELPPLPHAVVSPLGPVPVVVVPGLQCGGHAVYGCFDGVTRTIFIRDSMPRPVQWHTLFHEQFHVVLHDGGQSLLNPDGSHNNALEDKIADVVATARVNELLVLIQQIAAYRAAASRDSTVEQAGRARPAPAPASPP